MKIIAETASNHMGEIDYLKEITDKCFEYGADMVTVQIFDLDSFVSKYDEYHSNFKNICFEIRDWENYLSWAMKKGYDILPCVLDNKSLDLLRKMKFNKIKIHACDILNKDFLEIVNKYFDLVFLEFGGARFDEISSAIKSLKSTEVVLLYGFNDYPTKLKDQNLNLINLLKEQFNLEVGFCDHTTNVMTMPILAMTKGANYLEKHVTLNEKNRSRYDWQVSVEPKKIKLIKNNINKYSHTFGPINRTIKESENNFRSMIYKKLIFKKSAKVGTNLTKSHFTFKRSTEGLEISKLKNVIGKILLKDKLIDEPLLDSDVKK